MMQHGHALDCTLRAQLVVKLKWLNLRLEPGLDSSGLRFRLGFDSNRLRHGKCWTCCKCGLNAWRSTPDG